MDAAARRREARVRKILGNLDDRLQKISGSQVVCDQPRRPTPIVAAREVAKDLTDDCFLYKLAPDIKTKTDDKPLFQTKPMEEQKRPAESFVFDHLLPVVVVAIVTFALLRTHFGYLIYDSAMVPFYTLAIAKLIFKGNQRNGSNSIVMTVLTVAASSNKISSTIFQAYLVVSSISQDLCLYLFLIISGSVLFGAE